MPDDLNVQVSQRISVVLVYLLLLSVLALAIHFQGVFLVPVLCVAFLFIGNYWLFGLSSSAGRIRPLVWTGAALGLSILLAYWQQMLLLIPALLAALAALFVQYRFVAGRATGIANKVCSSLLGLAIAASGVYILSHLPRHPMLLVPGLLLVAVLSINVQLYVFRLFRVLSGRRSQIEFPTVEVDGVDEVLLIAETARRGLDPLNP